MKNKQTAVEWLVDQVKFIDKEVYAELYNQLLEQAKQMEKEQISRAYQEGLIDGMNHSPKDYYNKTYRNANDKRN